MNIFDWFVSVWLIRSSFSKVFQGLFGVFSLISFIAFSGSNYQQTKTVFFVFPTVEQQPTTCGLPTHYSQYLKHWREILQILTDELSGNQKQICPLNTLAHSQDVVQSECHGIWKIPTFELSLSISD